MSHSQFHSIESFILRHAWLNLWDERMTTGRINQITFLLNLQFCTTALQEDWGRLPQRKMSNQSPTFFFLRDDVNHTRMLHFAYSTHNNKQVRHMKPWILTNGLHQDLISAPWLQLQVRLCLPHTSCTNVQGHDPVALTGGLHRAVSHCIDACEARWPPGYQCQLSNRKLMTAKRQISYDCFMHLQIKKHIVCSDPCLHPCHFLPQKSFAIGQTASLTLVGSRACNLAHWAEFSKK